MSTGIGDTMTDFSIYEVGPRDGLQNTDTIMPTTQKVEMIERIAQAGITNIEVGAMVNPCLLYTSDAADD